MSEITFPQLQLLWPRGDGAVRMLMYLLKLVLSEKTPNFTDLQLAQCFFRSTRTIERWRAHWEALGVLTSKQAHGRTWYWVNLPRLKELIAQAQIAQQVKEAEARARKLQARQQLIEELTAKLVTMGDLELSATRHNDGSQPDILSGTNTNLKSISCTTRTEESSGAEPLRTGDDHPEPRTAAKQHRSLSRKGSPTDREAPASPVNQSRNRRYWLDVAKRLVATCGQQWNKNLSQLLEGLEFSDLVRAVCAFWEQVNRGNVKNAPAWLTRAVQRRYQATKRFVMPDRLPGITQKIGDKSEQESFDFLKQQDQWHLFYPDQPRPQWWQRWIDQFGEPPNLVDTDDGIWVMVRTVAGLRLFRPDDIAAQMA